MSIDEVWAVFNNTSMSIVSVHASEYFATKALNGVLKDTKLSNPEKHYCVGRLSEVLDWLSQYYYSFNRYDTAGEFN